MDVLTGLNNRRGMEETVHPMWDQLCRRRANVALISFDLDYLKTINDTFGHQAGDFAIRLVASAIRESMPEKAVTARMGGDEFLAFVPDISEREAKKLPEMFEKKDGGEEPKREPVVSGSGQLRVLDGLPGREHDF